VHKDYRYGEEGNRYAITTNIQKFSCKLQGYYVTIDPWKREGQDYGKSVSECTKAQVFEIADAFFHYALLGNTAAGIICIYGFFLSE